MSHNPSNGPGPQDSQYNQQPGYGQEPLQKKGKKKWALGCIGLFVAVIILFAGCSALMGGGADDPAPTPTETATTPNTEKTEDAPATEKAPATTPPETTEPEPEAAETEAPDAGPNAIDSSLTIAQQNAVRSAESYIDFSGFSRSGLTEQLEFEGYSNADATVAVDSLDIDYNDQAAESAQSYLDMSGFSRSGLIEQLMFEGYTAEQTAYGADQVGL